MRKGEAVNRLDIDRTSLLVTCPVDVPLSLLERRLNREGLTLGYRPRTPVTTLGQALERRVPNRDGLLYGGIDDLCVSIHAVRKGETIATRNVPRASTGPDFKKILIGSDRRYARLVKAALKIHPLPEARETLRLVWKEKSRRDDFVKTFWASGIRPARFQASGRRIAVTIEGTRAMVAAEKKCLQRLARETRGRPA